MAKTKEGNALGPTLAHPLMGASVATLLRAFTRYGGVPLKRWPLAAAMFGSAALRSPLTLWEALRATSALHKTSPAPAPVFIVGHWRSGTTHLHNLMGRDPQFGHISPLAAGLPCNLLTLVRWFRPALEMALPQDRHVDRVAVTPESPQEDEIPLASMQPLSVFHALYFPRRFREIFNAGVFFDGVTARDVERWKHMHRLLLHKASTLEGGRRILLKNPVYTARLALLREIWPEARFIHIYRNPYHVFRSTLHYYRRLVPDLALQSHEHIQWEPFVLESYVRLMARLDAQAETLPAEQFVEVRYETLEAQPLAELKRIYAQLRLPGFDAARPAVEAYLKGIAGYRKNTYDTLSNEERERVEATWGPYIERWGYTP